MVFRLGLWCYYGFCIFATVAVTSGWTNEFEKGLAKKDDVKIPPNVKRPAIDGRHSEKGHVRTERQTLLRAFVLGDFTQVEDRNELVKSNNNHFRSIDTSFKPRKILGGVHNRSSTYYHPIINRPKIGSKSVNKKVHQSTHAFRTLKSKSGTEVGTKKSAVFSGDIRASRFHDLGRKDTFADPIDFMNADSIWNVGENQDGVHYGDFHGKQTYVNWTRNNGQGEGNIVSKVGESGGKHQKKQFTNKRRVYKEKENEIFHNIKNEATKFRKQHRKKKDTVEKYKMNKIRKEQKKYVRGNERNHLLNPMTRSKPVLMHREGKPRKPNPWPFFNFGADEDIYPVNNDAQGIYYENPDLRDYWWQTLDTDVKQKSRYVIDSVNTYKDGNTFDGFGDRRPENWNDDFRNDTFYTDTINNSDVDPDFVNEVKPEFISTDTDDSSANDYSNSGTTKDRTKLANGDKAYKHNKTSMGEYHKLTRDEQRSKYSSDINAPGLNARNGTAKKNTDLTKSVLMAQKGFFYYKVDGNAQLKQSKISRRDQRKDFVDDKRKHIKNRAVQNDNKVDMNREGKPSSNQKKKSQILQNVNWTWSNQQRTKGIEDKTTKLIDEIGVNGRKIDSISSSSQVNETNRENNRSENMKLDDKVKPLKWENNTSLSYSKNPKQKAGKFGKVYSRRVDFSTNKQANTNFEPDRIKGIKKTEFGGGVLADQQLHGTPVFKHHSRKEKASSVQHINDINDKTVDKNKSSSLPRSKDTLMKFIPGENEKVPSLHKTSHSIRTQAHEGVENIRRWREDRRNVKSLQNSSLKSKSSIHPKKEKRSKHLIIKGDKPEVIDPAQASKVHAESAFDNSRLSLDSENRVEQTLLSKITKRVDDQVDTITKRLNTSFQSLMTQFSHYIDLEESVLQTKLDRFQKLLRTERKNLKDTPTTGENKLRNLKPKRLKDAAAAGRNIINSEDSVDKRTKTFAKEYIDIFLAESNYVENAVKKSLTPMKKDEGKSSKDESKILNSAVQFSQNSESNSNNISLNTSLNSRKTFGESLKSGYLTDDTAIKWSTNSINKATIENKSDSPTNVRQVDFQEKSRVGNTSSWGETGLKLEGESNSYADASDKLKNEWSYNVPRNITYRIGADSVANIDNYDQNRLGYENNSVRSYETFPDGTNHSYEYADKIDYNVTQETKSDDTSRYKGIFGNVDVDIEESCLNAQKGDFARSCPKGWINHKQFCFSLSKATESWDDVSKACANMDGTIAMPKSQDLLAFLIDELRARKLYSQPYLVGLRKVDEDWVWLDDTPLSHAVSVGQEEEFSSCAVILEGSLRKQPCSAKSGYICEVKLGVEAVRVLALGDSLTKGYHSSGRNYNPYSRKLEQLLNKDNHRCFSVETSGQTGEKADEMLQRLKDSINKELNNFDWVVILAGTNDLLASSDSPDTIAEHILAMHMVAHVHGARTLVVTIPEIFCETSWCVDAKRRRGAVNKKLRAYAEAGGSKVYLSDISHRLSLHQLSPRERKAFWEPSGVHMKPAGYDAMAHVIFKDLMEAIESPS